jgi:LCP family protein required for cell wall assembly
MDNSHKAVLWLFLKATLITFALVFLFFILTLGGVSIFAWRKTQQLSQAAGVPFSQLLETFKTGWNTEPQQTNNNVNFLILGTDELENRKNTVELTDTLLIASINLNTGRISLFSLPRDLWHSEYQTKINALYAYGKQRFPTTPERFPKEVIEGMIGIPIHHTIVLKLETVAQLIDDIGGIEIDVKEGFVDTEFPRSDVDIAVEKDPAKLYETVEFKTGVEKMSGERVLKYIRSRHSKSDQGTDDARAQRQQQVIMTLVKKFEDPQFFLDLNRTGKLYQFYIQHFQSALPMTELIGIAKKLLPHRSTIEFLSGSPSIFPDDKNGTIFHPQLLPKYQKQWVYDVRDPEKFKQEAQHKLGF